MEFLEQIADFFSSFFGRIERLVTRLFGSANERRIRKIGFRRDPDGSPRIEQESVIARTNDLEPEYEARSDAELKETVSRMRRRLDDGETVDDVIPDVFAAVREAGRRFLQMRHYDVQLIGGYILHQGMIAEMVTGEGKTLVATLAAVLNALSGKVHVVTVNDYLARRDMEWMGPVYLRLGLTVGAIQSQMKPHERQEHYACDITYGTNNEFGFDYLRDNMKATASLQVQGPLDFAIVDEIDNILIDEARTPLIISGPAQDDVTKYARAERIARKLKRDEHFEIKEKEHTCHLTDEGIRAAEQEAGVESFYTTGNMEWPHLIDNSLKAHFLYKVDVNYVIEGGEIIIVDEFTGRKMPGRQWSDGLHQAVEAKEGVPIKEENQTLATITLQNYFKLYDKLAGMTGTAMTEAGEFLKIYGLDVVAVPTNCPLIRTNHPDVIFRTETEKWDAVIDEIQRVKETGRPVLVGTSSIEKSELVARKLERCGVDFNVLNAKHPEREAEVIAQAGRRGAVTISTNMAGRGTDIILGGNPEHLAWQDLGRRYESRLEVPKAEWDGAIKSVVKAEGMEAEGRTIAENGGLHVVGTDRHDARRIDLQLRGRAGRQGDPGSSRFFLSMEDDLMRLFIPEFAQRMITASMSDGEAIESKMVTRRIEGAQKKVEERHFETRKHLLEYDEVMDEQRKRVYAYRQRILDGANCRDLIIEMIERQTAHWTGHFLSPNHTRDTIAAWAGQELHIEVDRSDVRDMDAEQLTAFLKDEARRQAVDLIREQIDEDLPEDVDDEKEWSWKSLTGWVNSYFGLNLKDRDLIHIGNEGREAVREHLLEEAGRAIDRYDCRPLDTFLDDAWPRLSLCDWLAQQFTLEITPEQLVGNSDEQVIDDLQQKLSKLYRDKEIQFPVSVGITNFLANTQVPGGQNDREGLIRWANDRFECNLSLADFTNRQRNEIEQVLVRCSESYFSNGECLSQVEDFLDRAYGDRNGSQPSNETPSETVLAELSQWAEREFKAELDPSQLATLNRGDARQAVLSHFDRRFRPELCQAERSLILEILDFTWKEHLHYMDHLRSGIGLVGYAQKDPKVEYKREGMLAFESMWDRVDDQVTSAVFRIEQESPEFVGALWEITGTDHQEARSAYDEDDGGLEPGQEAQAIEPIRNRQPKVGRNDPCPCGSGKKYKKCHGR